MCESCWDADKMEAKIQMGDTSCTGMEMEILSLDELKYFLTREWMETDKSDYRVFKQAVPEIRGTDSISWMATHPNQLTQRTKLTVRLV